MFGLFTQVSDSGPSCFYSCQNENICCDPSLKPLGKTVLMMGHNICFKGVIWKIIPKLSLLPLLIWTTGNSCGSWQPSKFVTLSLRKLWGAWRTSTLKICRPRCLPTSQRWKVCGIRLTGSSSQNSGHRKNSLIRIKVCPCNNILK